MKKTPHSRRRLATWLIPLSLLVSGGCSSSQKTASTGKVPAENPSLFQSFMLGVFNTEKDDADKTETAEQADAADSQGVVVASDEQSVPPKGQASPAGGATQAAPTRAASARTAAKQAAPTRAAATDAASPPPQYGPADPTIRR